MSLKLLEQRLLLPSPVQTLRFVGSEERGQEIFVKREDLIHGLIGGNKWRKLKYNLSQFQEGDYDGIASLGGPYSNHLIALAFACKVLKIRCVGFVRSNQIDGLNPTIQTCRKLGMAVLPIHPNEYADRHDENEMDIVSRQSWIKHPYFIPEGGSNELSLKGCREMLEELAIDPDFIVLPIGTGATMAAITKGSACKVVGISPFKKDKVVIPFEKDIRPPHEILYDFALNGFGRYHEKLIDVIHFFWKEYGIPLDPIYNAKGMMALQHMIANNFFPEGVKILYINTGGLQGIQGFNQLHANRKPINIPQSIYSPTVDL